MLGWISIAVGLAVGFTLYAMMECTSPLTYYHRKFYKLYREQEEAEFDDEMKQKVLEVIKFKYFQLAFLICCN